MLPTNNSYYCSTSYPHRLSHHRPQVRNDRWGAERETSGTLPPAPGTPWVPATDAAAPLFLPPTLSLIHPALYLPALIFVLLTLCPPPPSPPHGDNNANGPSPGDVRPQTTQSASLSSPPSRAGGGGAEHRALLLLGACSRSVGYLRRVIPRHRHRCRGLGGGERLGRRLPGAGAVTEEAATAVIMTCFVVGCSMVFVGWWRCELLIIHWA
jgi:hypothetical protein